MLKKKFFPYLVKLSKLKWPQIIYGISTNDAIYFNKPTSLLKILLLRNIVIRKSYNLWKHLNFNHIRKLKIGLRLFVIFKNGYKTLKSNYIKKWNVITKAILKRELQHHCYGKFIYFTYKKCTANIIKRIFNIWKTYTMESNKTLSALEIVINF